MKHPDIPHPNEQARTPEQIQDVEAIGSVLEMTRFALSSMPEYCRKPAIVLLEQLAVKPHNVDNLICSAAIVDMTDEKVVTPLTVSVGQIALMLLQLYNPPSEAVHNIIPAVKAKDFEKN